MHAALQDQMGRSLLVMLDLIYIYVSARVYAEIFYWVLEGQLKAVLKESVVYLCVVTLLAIALSILLIDCKGRTFISIELRSSWGQVGEVAGRNHKSGKPGWIGIQKRKRTDGLRLGMCLTSHFRRVASNSATRVLLENYIERAHMARITRGHRRTFVTTRLSSRARGQGELLATSPSRPHKILIICLDWVRFEIFIYIRFGPNRVLI